MSIFDLLRSKNYLEIVKEVSKEPAKESSLPEPERQVTPKNMPNQRNHSRYNSLFSAKIWHQKQPIPATVINYSETGVGIIVDKEIELNDSIELELLPRHGRPITVKADVKRCLEVDNKYMVGAQITIIGGKYASTFRNLELHGSGH